MRRTRLTLALALVAGSALVGIPTTATAAPSDVDVQLLAMSDFHGRIAPQSGSDGLLDVNAQGPGPDGVPGNADDKSVAVGGAAYVQALQNQLRTDFVANGGGATANSLLVGAGDMISASPFESSVFKDEPTIEVLNALGMDYSSVGNHEFDRGIDELRRIDGGGCAGTANVDSCFVDSTGDATFDGADFPYLAANVTRGGVPVLPPYAIQTFTDSTGQTARLGLIGVVTDTTPGVVSPAGVAGLQFGDEAEAINRYAAVLQTQGVQAIAVMVHEGGTQTGRYQDCAGLTGPVVDINAATTAAVDIIISAHTHVPYDCTLPVPAAVGGSAADLTDQRLVTQAGFYGKALTDIRMEISPTTGDVDRQTLSATNVAVDRATLTPDPTIQAIVDYWVGRANGPGNVPVGQITADITRGRTPAGGEDRTVESPLGNLVADSQLAALQSDLYGNPVVAFMNPGGLRTDLLYATAANTTAAIDPPGTVRYRELFNVQPFSNTVNAITLTGAAIDQVLEEQFAGSNGRATRLGLSVSDSLRYQYVADAPLGQHVDICSITIDGVRIDPAAEYRVVANSFLAGGGDSFAGFATGTNSITGPVDVDAFEEYFAATPVVAPPAVGRGSLQTGPVDCGTAPVPPTTPQTPGTQPIANPGNGIAAGQLANTGAATGQLTALGVGLLLAGGVATAAGYRRGRGVTD